MPEIAMPFHVGADGRVYTTDDPDARVRLHVLALINTHPNERVTVPGYGTPVVNMLFEDMDEDEIETQASTMLNDSFSMWEPGVSLDSVTVDDKGSENSTAVLDVRYSRRDAADSESVANANLAIIGANGTVREIVRG